MFIRLLLISLMILLFYFGYKASEKIKRKKEKSNSDLRLLKARKIGIIKEYKIQNKKDIIQNIINKLEEYNPRIIRATEDEALIFFSDSGETKYKGMVNTPDEKMPVRIILKVRSKVLSVQLDEDYEKPMFVRTGKKIFREKYINAFNYYLNIIESSFDRFETVF
ncbi:MAG: hypothetical protein K8R54_01960 [Bacteroidales bacterium]|nr:hypothetical protein [Bacteroidales bacterium]